jgi:hypothetical protein
VAKLADNDDSTIISQKIAEAVLKPLLEEYISPPWKKIFKFKDEWFT